MTNKKKERFKKILQRALIVATEKNDKQKINKIKEDLKYLEEGGKEYDKNE